MTDTISPYAIYTISDENIGSNTGPKNSYIDLQTQLKGAFDVILIDIFPKSISLNVMNMVHHIQNDMYKNYKGIYLIGWGVGGSICTEVAYFINNFIKPSYVLGIIYLATQQAETELIQYLDIKCIFVHGKADNVHKYTISENLYKNYNHTNKELILLDYQDHQFTLYSSNITEIIYNIFNKIYSELNNPQNLTQNLTQNNITWTTPIDGFNNGYMDCTK